MKFGLTEKEQKIISDAMLKFPSIQEAIIFGSRAMGNYKKGSDIDIALKGTISEKEILQLKSLLEEETTLPYFFDVVHYDHINNSALKTHIDQFGQQFHLKTR